ncbi:hypothetical protein BDB00DRAFT_813357, partial [Zychaea mexicana]|uniref:uncharacterized protein n=1 Tax=Zychaea mexicana TaxID=64656 RepID=UPI0022FE701A
MQSELVYHSLVFCISASLHIIYFNAHTDSADNRVVRPFYMLANTLYSASN